MKKMLLIPLLSGMLSTSYATTQTPENLFPDGPDSVMIVNPYTGESAYARKGTVATTLANTHTLNQLLNNPPSAKNNALVEDIIEQHKKLLSSLKAIGVFNLFSINEWLVDEKTQPGRCLLGLLYLQKYPSEITDDTKKIINTIRQSTTNTYLISAINNLKLK